MSNATQPFIEQSPIRGRRGEPVNKLMIKMRNRGVKRPRCRSKVVMVASGVSVLLLIVGLIFILSESSADKDETAYEVPGSFLIDGPNCKIPNLNPFAKEAMKVFKREKFEPCSPYRPLTSVETFADGRAKLRIHKDRKKDYLSWWQSDLKCCYQRITRAGANKTADSEVKLSDCKEANSGHFLDLDDEFILVTCTGFKRFLFWRPSSEVYKNAHAIIRPKESVKRKLKRSSKDKTSVFLMGIDSISRLNLIRGLPQTYDYLESNGWFEMRGLTKIGDNTFPNLMALLTGHNDTITDEICNWREVGELEKCNFIWNDYDSAGYVTAYAEDEVEINTFNFYETGFIKQPTDYYLRPFALGAEAALKIKKKNDRIMCLGQQHYADFVYQYGLDFGRKYRDEPSFGLFWTNSFSHEDLSMSSAMDTRVLHYLSELQTQGILNNSVVFFFSDHGMRFGPIRNHFIGWLEERLPFFYIWLPENFKAKYPSFVKNLQTNRDRLSSPYDVHITLKHILQLSGGYEGDNQPSAVSCQNCQSLFSELPLDRSCADAGISKHWCTCVEFQEVDKSSKVVDKAVNHIIKEINAELSPYPKCAKLKLKDVHSARKSKHQGSTDYLVSFNANPSQAQLEATVRCNDDCESFTTIGSVSRLNRYGNQSWCISDSKLRKYCYCQ